MWKYWLTFVTGIALTGLSGWIYFWWADLTIVPRRIVATQTQPPVVVHVDDFEREEHEEDDNQHVEDEINDLGGNVEDDVQPEPEPELLPIVHADQPVIRPVFFSLIVDNNEQEFESVDLLIGSLQGLQHARSQITLTASFPRAHYHDEDKFKRWVARLGDYILARRIIIHENLLPVIRENADLMRVTSLDVQSRGCAVLTVNDDRFVVTVRGLESNSTELEIIAGDILTPVSMNPSLLADCKNLRVKEFLEFFSEQDPLRESESARWLIRNIPNKLTMSKVMSDALQSAGVLVEKIPGANRGALMFFIDYSELERTSEPESSEIKESTSEMVGSFLESIRGDISRESALLARAQGAKLNETQFASLTKLVSAKNTKTALAALKRWVQTTKISNLLKRSLVAEPAVDDNG